MKSSLISGPSRWFSALGATLLIVSAAGCASPGQPRPPSLDLPETVQDLTAKRIGDEVQLHWTTPEKTTDRIAVKGPMTASICRIANPPSATCTPIKQLQVQSGPSQAVDTLPQPLTVDPPTLLAYRIEILNSKGHSAGLSPDAFAAAGAAPPAIQSLRATPTRDGAMLEWQQTSNSAAIELDRLPIGPDGVVILPPPPKSSSKSTKPATKPTQKTAQKPQSTHPSQPTTAPQPKSPLQSTSTPIEVKLQTPDPSPTQPPDPGGTIDHTVQMGESYRYTAQRVRSVALGGHALELRSPISSPATVVMKNTFPPHPPTGLEAIPGGATAADRSIDLSWTPNTDPDLAGYNVYRQDIDAKGAAAGTAARLNTIPVAGPAYRDQTAVPGRRYAYHVTAVDTAGNESAPSADVQETAREQ